jgi:hypothetical protein
MSDELPQINSEEEFHALDDETKQKLLKQKAGSEGGVYETNAEFNDANG